MNAPFLDQNWDFPFQPGNSKIATARVLILLAAVRAGKGTAEMEDN